MIKKQFYGKTVEEAIKTGLAQLDISFDQGEINIIDEGSKGIFGIGGKKACVEIIVKNEDEELLDQQKEKAKIELENQVIIEEKETITVNHSEKPQSVEKFTKPQFELQEYTQEQVEEQLILIKEFLTGLFTHMNMSVKMDIKNNDDDIVVNIDGDDIGKIIGYRGETLDAVQYLTRLMLNRKRASYKRVIVHTENYRQKREETLVLLAKRLARKVEQTGMQVVLEPMKPYERRIIHATLQDYSNIKTFSEGEDQNRHIIIEKK